LSHPVDAEHVDIHQPLELGRLDFDQRPANIDSSIVNQSVQPAPAPTDLFHRSIDVFLDRDIETYRFHVIEGVEFVHIRLLARPGIHEISLAREPLGNGTTDSCRCTGYQDRF
jgi:hypothetical protein